MCVHVYVYVHIHACLHTYIHTYIQTYATRVYVFARILICPTHVDAEAVDAGPLLIVEASSSCLPWVPRATKTKRERERERDRERDRERLTQTSCRQASNRENYER